MLFHAYIPAELNANKVKVMLDGLVEVCILLGMENNISLIYDTSDIKAMFAPEKVTTCWAKSFDGLMLRGGERRLLAKFFWRERKFGKCSRSKLIAFASRWA